MTRGKWIFHTVQSFYGKLKGKVVQRKLKIPVNFKVQESF